MRVAFTSLALSLALSVPMWAGSAKAAQAGGAIAIEDSVVYFSADSEALTNEGELALRELAQWLMESPDRGVVLGEATGMQSVSDQQLAERRAHKTRDYLISQGVNDEQITVITMGQEPGTQRPYIESRQLTFAEADTTRMGADELDMGFDTASDAGPFESQEDEGFGVLVSIGGGGTGFVTDGARDVADVGQLWEARVTVGANSFIAGEVAYVGTHHQLDVTGDDSTNMVGNGAEGNLRVNFTDWDFQPYAFAGFGWSYLNIVDGPTAGLVQDDNLIYVPAGLGIGYRIGDFLVDVRGTFRTTFEDDAFQGFADNGDTGPSLHNWDATARIGWEID